jgi:uncharacterized membrane protein
MTTSNHNPYQPPKADVTPPLQEFEAGELIDGGEAVPAGNGLQWIGDAFKLFGKAPGIWILNIIIVIVLSFVLALIPFIGSIASTLLMPVIIAGILIGCRSLEAGNALQVEHLFAGFKEKTSQLVLIGLFMLAAYVIIGIVIFVLAAVIVGTGFLQSIGDQRALATWFIEHGLPMLLVLVLLAFALFIPLMMAYWFAPALVVFHNMTAIDAMKNSFVGCLRNVLPFLLYGVVALVLMIVAVIPLGLGLLVFVPMMYASIYTSYKDIYMKK